MIGRQKEIKELNSRYDSKDAEFIVIYGRRRIGKTYLINEVFKNRITFHHAGLSPETADSAGMLKAQLNNFYLSLQLYGMKKSHRPTDWSEAFFMLENLLMEKDDGTRQVVFIDELPWLDTPRSGFIGALEAFWNSWGCARNNLMLIVCGSASSWILDKLINNYGGLYNRTTCEIKLYPFNLCECEEYIIDRGIRFSRYDIAQSYMIIGGIPYYLGYLNGELSLPQNVDALFFSPKAKLREEFDRLFASIFSNPEQMKEIVSFLYTRGMGYPRNEIAKALKMSDGGTLTQNLNALVASDFVMKYIPTGIKRRQEYFKLIDPFCIFYLRFVRDKERLNRDFWKYSSSSQKITSWRGIAFENLCFNHIPQIKAALGITGVETAVSTWIKRGDSVSDGVQVDLLIDRDDNVINLCEIKYYSEKFRVNKDDYLALIQRQSLLESEVPSKKTIRHTLITTVGLLKNEYSNIFSNLIILDDLFKK